MTTTDRIDSPDARASFDMPNRFSHWINEAKCRTTGVNRIQNIDRIRRLKQRKAVKITCKNKHPIKSFRNSHERQTDTRSDRAWKQRKCRSLNAKRTGYTYERKSKRVYAHLPEQLTCRSNHTSRSIAISCSHEMNVGIGIRRINCTLQCKMHNYTLASAYGIQLGRVRGTEVVRVEKTAITFTWSILTHKYGWFCDIGLWNVLVLVAVCNLLKLDSLIGCPRKAVVPIDELCR